MSTFPDHHEKERRPFQKIPVRPINFLTSETIHRTPSSRSFENKTPWYRRIHFSWRLLFCIGLGIFFLWFTIWLFIPIHSPETEELYNSDTSSESTRPTTLFGRIKELVFSGDVVLKAEKRDRINILLLGQGGPGHDGPFLTDTIIIASIKQSTKEVALISIPRDLAITIPGENRVKINSINHLGEKKKSGTGASFAAKTIGDFFDLPIHYYARIDFYAFEELIDEVGGITIDVERSFTDNEYPGPNFTFQTVSFKKGEQTMNGSRALIYARSRHGNNGEGSDFARAKRQQKMILAVKEKMLSFGVLANPVRINQLFTTFESHLSTNLSYGEIAALLRLAKEVNRDELRTLVFDNREGGFLVDSISPEGAYILSPVTGNFDAMKQAIASVFEETPVVINTTPEQTTPVKPIATIEIQNGTWRGGLGARTAKHLTEKGLTISVIGNTLNRPIAESGAYPVSARALPELVKEAAESLGVPAKTELPAGEMAASTTDILIILGDDFTEPSP